MTNYFLDYRRTGKENPYNWDNFYRLLKIAFPEPKIRLSGKFRLEDESKGRRFRKIHVPSTENSPEAIIHVRQKVSSLPEREKGKRDNWGKNIVTFTRIEIEETSGKGNLARILRSSDFTKG